MARTFAESGSNAIAILDLDENLAKEAANDLVQWFEEHGQAKKGEIKCIGIGCDVANEESVKASFKQVVDTFGRVDSLVTAAGIVGTCSSSRPYKASILTHVLARQNRELCRNRVPGRQVPQAHGYQRGGLFLLRSRSCQGHDEARCCRYHRLDRFHVGSLRQ